jgi:hypothetical protein
VSSKYVNFVSPRGTAKYPKTDQPYSWSNAQNRSVPDADGQFELVTIMSSDDFKPFKKVLDEAIAQSGLKPQNLPYKKEIDKDTGEPTGNVEVKFKAYGKTKTGELSKIKFVDAKARPMPSNFPLTSGSVVKVDGYVSVAKLGARLNMRAVQVISLAEGSSSFTAEDGFEWDGEQENKAETTVGSHNEKASDDNLDF